MSELFVALAITDGFWGQVFEYWPFTGTVGVTLIFGIIVLVADTWWRHELPPPEGAKPRVDIPVDPRVAPRRWISRGRTLLRFGSGIGIFFGFIYASFAFNPQGLNDQFALQQEQDTVFAISTVVALAALAAGYAATVYLRNRPERQLFVLVVATFLGLTAPWLFTLDLSKLGVSVGVLGAPILFMALGIGYMFYGYQALRTLQRNADATAAANSS